MQPNAGQTPDQPRVEKGLAFLSAVKRFCAEDDVRGAIGTLRLGKDTRPRPDPKRGRRPAAPVVSAASLHKALQLTNLATKAEAAGCLAAVVKHGGARSAGTGKDRAALDPAFVALVAAALDAYQAGGRCFDDKGAVVHALKAR